MATRNGLMGIFMGWTFFMPGTHPEYISRGMKNLRKNMRGMKFFGEILWGMK